MEPEALEGCWGLVMCVEMSALEGLLGAMERVEGRGVEHTLAAAVRAALRRLVLMSAPCWGWESGGGGRSSTRSSGY